MINGDFITRTGEYKEFIILTYVKIDYGGNLVRTFSFFYGRPFLLRSIKYPKSLR